VGSFSKTKTGSIDIDRIVGYGLAGCEPSIMGIGPVPAVRSLLGKTGVKLEDIDEVDPGPLLLNGATTFSIMYFLCPTLLPSIARVFHCCQQLFVADRKSSLE
jgi:Thiolase, C-terminal domain